MKTTTENVLQKKGIFFSNGELNRNKLNLISGATIPQYCNFFWDFSLRDIAPP